MYCEQCGKEIPDNSKFCDECGAPVRDAQTDGPQYTRSPYGHQTMNQQPYNRPQYGRDNSGGQMSSGKQKKDKNIGMTVLIVILSLVAVALVAAFVVLGIRYFGGSGSERQTDREVVQESGLETDRETETETETDPPVSSSTAASAPSQTSPSSSEAPSSEALSNDYILPNSNSAYLTEADLAGLTKEELRIARNEIYARHGRKFKDASLSAYFMSKSWYHPTVEPENFNESVFNDYEIANRKLIGDYEKKMGY